MLIRQAKHVAHVSSISASNSELEQRAGRLQQHTTNFDWVVTAFFIYWTASSKCDTPIGSHATLPAPTIGGTRHTLTPRPTKQNMAATVQEEEEIQSRTRERAITGTAHTTITSQSTTASICPNTAPTATTTTTTVPDLSPNPASQTPISLYGERQKPKPSSRHSKHDINSQ